MNNFDNIKKGDRVKIETHEGDFAEFTVHTKEYRLINSKANRYDHRNIKSLEILPLPLPTRRGAMVGHPTDSGYVHYTLESDGSWYFVSGVTKEIFKVDLETVRSAIREVGMTVLFEGVA